MSPDDYLVAARVPDILKPQGFGAWLIERWNVQPGSQQEWVGWPTITLLRRFTEATLHCNGEVVMEDSRTELSRHLPIWLRASGRVLITGLGLGCVVRGLLSKPSVEHIDVVEIDPAVLRVVGPEFYGNPRVSLFRGDALTFTWKQATRWDYAWHDIWAPKKLHVLHGRLMIRYHDRVGHQGAWMLPRPVKHKYGQHFSLLG
jgi:hypothetical protein